ncbi:MAG: hypothetical protein ABIT07_12610 [Ferruginibacter sp.]
MKQVFSTIAVMLVISFNVNAQEIKSKPSNLVIEGLAAKIQDNQLLINWASEDAGANNYWEVQGSRDGKEFSTIGLVLGADPQQGNGTYKFKQQIAKLKSGLKYYRVLNVESNDRATASNTVSIAK